MLRQPCQQTQQLRCSTRNTLRSPSIGDLLGCCGDLVGLLSNGLVGLLMACYRALQGILTGHPSRIQKGLFS